MVFVKPKVCFISFQRIKHLSMYGINLTEKSDELLKSWNPLIQIHVLYLKMSSVIPVFANDALDHLVRSFVLGVGVRPVACAVDTLEVLVVTEKIIRMNLLLKFATNKWNEQSRSKVVYDWQQILLAYSTCDQIHPDGLSTCCFRWPASCRWQACKRCASTSGFRSRTGSDVSCTARRSRAKDDSDSCRPENQSNFSIKFKGRRY